jgi:hypothetical protein
MRRSVVCILVLFAFAEPARSQDAPIKPAYDEVTRWYAVVIGDGTIEGADRVVVVGGPYVNKWQADEKCKQWSDMHPESNRLCLAKDITERIPGGGPGPKPRPGPMLPEPRCREPGKAGPQPPVQDPEMPPASFLGNVSSRPAGSTGSCCARARYAAEIESSFRLLMPAARRPGNRSHPHPSR